MKIAVAGAGYVGLSLSVLFAQQHDVWVLDIDREKVALLEKGISPIKDREIEAALSNSHWCNNQSSFHATDDEWLAYRDASFIVIATPTNYDPEKDYFDTSSIERVLDSVRLINDSAWIVIKSTVPVGYTERIIKEEKWKKILFSPEFLREGRALYDNLHPSRIIVGTPVEQPDYIDAATRFARLLADGACDEDRLRENGDGSVGIPQLVVNSTEAEAVKLFSNTYLAMRISFFNELDTYCEVRGLNTLNVIKGVCLEPRIGNHYNNPSFGYGGYCLPKDTKQLLANYRDIPQNIVSAVVEANATRKKFIADEIDRKGLEFEKMHGYKPCIGVYRLTMKSGSDNFRSSSIQDVISLLVNKKYSVLVYEPTCASEMFEGGAVTKDFSVFKTQADLIVANRWSEELSMLSDRVYTRDLFHKD